jgi:ornithine cyclodeaminase/alanine dehydrogenase-like protein (mu-crystallin family)
MTAEQVKAFREYYKCYRWIMDKKGPTEADFLKMNVVGDAVVAAFHAEGCSAVRDRLWLAAVRLWGRQS